MMQAIWSRTAQTRSCRCRSCFHAATNVARRATTVASRRRLKVSDIFTACYSTILATAAVADAKVKEDRRREWDRAIAEAKGTTPWSASNSSHTSLEGVSTEKLNLPGVSAQTETEFTTYSPFRDVESQYAQGSNFETRLKALDQEIRESSVNVRKTKIEGAQDAETLQKASELEWIDEEPDEILSERDPKCPLHLERRELSCANLVEQLLARLVGSVQRRAQSTPAEPAHPKLKDIALRIQHLRGGHKKLPTYVWENLAVIEQERRELHRSLLAICDEATLDDIPSLELMLAKICYNLLLCTSPISMVTYNILIQALDRLQQYELAQVIVDSFLYETKFKPNRNSIRIILEHYHLKKDVEGWRAIKNRMRATQGDMRIKRRWKGDLGILPIQDWIANTHPRDLKFQKNIGFLTQKPPRDSNVFDALIRTSLTFNGPRNAILHIKRALWDYQQVYSDTICSVMEELLARRDERGSTSLLNQILSLWDEDGDPSAIVFTAAVRRLIYQLLDMIGVDTSLGSKRIPPNKLSREKLQAMLRQLRIFSVEDSIARTEDFVKTIEDHLEDICYSQAGIVKAGAAPQESELLYLDTRRNLQYPSTSDMVETPQAKERASLDWFSEVERMRANDMIRNTANGRWSRLELLEKHLEFSMQKIEGLRTQTLPLGVKAMPHYQQLRYLDITTSNMVYRNKAERPSQYEELLRVRSEGATGLLDYVEKQLSASRTALSKIEAEVFSMKGSVTKLGYSDLECYLKRAAKQLIINEKRSSHLGLKISELSGTQKGLLSHQPPQDGGQSNETVISNDGATIANQRNIVCPRTDVSKQLWKLENSAREMDIHTDNLRQMWQNVNTSFRSRLIYKLHALITVNARILCKYEDQISALSPKTLTLTLPRAIRLINSSGKELDMLASEIKKLHHRWAAKRRAQLQAGARNGTNDANVREPAAQVDILHFPVRRRVVRKIEKHGLNGIVASTRDRCLAPDSKIKKLPCEWNDRRREQEMTVQIKRGIKKFGLTRMVGQSITATRTLERQVLKLHRELQARITNNQLSERVSDRVRNGVAHERQNLNASTAGSFSLSPQDRHSKQTSKIPMLPCVLPVLELDPAFSEEEKSMTVAAAAG